MNIDTVSKSVNFLVCPETKLPLELCSLEEAQQQIGDTLVARVESLTAKNKTSKPFGLTSQVLLRQDLQGAYPIVDGIPILLIPEMLTPPNGKRPIDLCQLQYAESYEEMEFYNEYAINESRQIKNSEDYTTITSVVNLAKESMDLFPHPKETWIDAIYDCAGQWDAYEHLAPISGKRFAQLGGKGLHAVKFLLAGAPEAWIITPMQGEAIFARALAEEFGVADKLRCVVAVAEELPIADGSIDSFYLGGCLHHMQTHLAFPEIKRVLADGGRFAAVDPWNAPLYALGTKILGKREVSVYCKPLTEVRLEPVKKLFTNYQVVQHGTLTRYPLLALNKFGINSSLAVAWQANQIDDAISSAIPGMRGMGSSVVVLCEK
jgi:uncharacterized protein YbaR (Trm112 family)/SAM-dependent methyltransferase